jgi:hypothetical protein
MGRTEGGVNSKLHAVYDADGKPLIPPLAEGQSRRRDCPAGAARRQYLDRQQGRRGATGSSKPCPV